jgi:hypothetical protein
MKLASPALALALLASSSLVSASNPASGNAVQTSAASTAETRARLVVLTDIGTDPDDEMSLVRLLLYANEIDIEGLAATTSTWLRTAVNPGLIEERVRAYGKVLPNLRRHASGYPDAATLLARIRSGQVAYGMEGVGADKDTAASRMIIEAVDRPDPRPVWIAVWGGANTLAQALWTVRHTRTPAQLDAFVAKLRVYAISDQDDAGPWLRAEFPKLWWIGSIHAYGAYQEAAWVGMHAPVPSPDSGTSTQPWLDAHIRKGPLGALYPKIAYIMEGDTPSFLNLIPNGLAVPEQPNWGGWGGRYGKVSDAYGLWADVADTVLGNDGKPVTGNQPTVWRWRGAVQSDFAARINWSMAPERQGANHHPVAVLNGRPGRQPVTIEACPGDTLRLSAAGTADPDANTLSYRWWQYKDIAGGFFPDTVDISGSGPDVEVRIPLKNSRGGAPAAKRSFHVILEVTDDGAPRLTSYRRAIITAPPEPARCPPPDR